MALRATQVTGRIAVALRRVARPFSTDAVVESEYKRGEIGKVSGIPEEHLTRKVIIYSPARTATQQGSGKLGKWKINFVSTLKWENPLMGWTSTGDPYANVGDSALDFDSEEAAKSFAERHGWDYVVKKPKTPLLKKSPRSVLISRTDLTMAMNKIVRLIAPNRSASSRFIEPVSRFLSSSTTPPPLQSPSPLPNQDQIVKANQNIQESLSMRKEEEVEEEEEGGGEFVNEDTGEIGGPRGPEPTRYGDWEQRGRCSDF